MITLNGATGEVIVGSLPLVDPELSGRLQELLGWAREVATTKVRANADTPDDAKKAREFEADGIGLVRTEHMFFRKDRILIVRQMIMADRRAGDDGRRWTSSCPSSARTSSGSSPR